MKLKAEETINYASYPLYFSHLPMMGGVVITHQHKCEFFRECLYPGTHISSFPVIGLVFPHRPLLLSENLSACNISVAPTGRPGLCRTRVSLTSQTTSSSTCIMSPLCRCSSRTHGRLFDTPSETPSLSGQCSTKRHPTRNLARQW